MPFVRRPTRKQNADAEEGPNLRCPRLWTLRARASAKGNGTTCEREPFVKRTPNLSVIIGPRSGEMPLHHHGHTRCGGNASLSLSRDDTAPNRPAAPWIGGRRHTAGQPLFVTRVMRRASRSEAEKYERHALDGGKMRMQPTVAILTSWWKCVSLSLSRHDTAPNRPAVPCCWTAGDTHSRAATVRDQSSCVHRASRGRKQSRSTSAHGNPRD